MTAELAIQYLLAGVTYGSIYAIVAIGFNIIYNTTGIINFAQGEFVMLGGMIAATLAPHMPLAAAVGAAVVGVAVLGALVELVFIRWLRDPGVLRMIVITIGLSILLREAALHIWGPNPKHVPPFSGREVYSVEILGATMAPQALWILGTAAAIMIALTLFFRFTWTGRQMRACASNRNAARLCGIHTGNLVTLAFLLAAGTGALAGCVISPMAYTMYDSGTGLAIKGFTVAILGGLGNSAAAVAAGLLLGVLEAFSIHVMPAAYKDAIAIAILLLILVLRPHGLFGSRTAGALKEF